MAAFCDDGLPPTYVRGSDYVHKSEINHKSFHFTGTFRAFLSEKPLIISPKSMLCMSSLSIQSNDCAFKRFSLMEVWIWLLARDISRRFIFQPVRWYSSLPYYWHCRSTIPCSWHIDTLWIQKVQEPRRQILCRVAFHAKKLREPFNRTVTVFWNIVKCTPRRRLTLHAPGVQSTETDVK